MTRRVREKKSRRQSLRLKGTIQKKVKAWRKKKNKETRRLAKMGIVKRKKKTMVIPNSWVGKEKLLREEIKLRKKEMKEEAERVTLKKLKRQAAKLIRQDIARNSGVNANFKDPATQTNIREANKEVRKKHYLSELDKVIKACDVVVQVLDARDPLGCRCKELETRVASMKAANNSKKLIFLLNKIDLIPPKNICKWVQYLRREYPVIAFKASTQGLTKNFGRKHRQNPHIYKQGAKCVGDEALLNLLKSYSGSIDTKKSISIGFVGYPNVGKSTIINSLKKKEVVIPHTSPGFTEHLQEVHLDKHICLVDSPGIILNEGDDLSNLFLKDSVRLQDIDMIEAVNKVISRSDPM